jgi:hypothetical protein
MGEIDWPSPDPAKSPSFTTGVFTDALWPGHPFPRAGEGVVADVFSWSLSS